MASAKRAKAKSAPKGASKAFAVQPATDPGTGLLSMHLFDGTRQKIKAGTEVLVTIHDGAQNQLFRDFLNGSDLDFRLPFHNNFADNYSIVAFADDYEQVGFQPVKVGPNAPQSLDLMLLPKDGDFHFAKARWSDVQAKKPVLGQVFAASVTGDAGAAYETFLEDNPGRLACLLNIATAMQQVFLAQGTPLDYFKQLDLPALREDRIFGYADAKLVNQVKLAAQQGIFDLQPAIDLTQHGDATSSFKQKQFGEANLQITFHEKNRKTIGGVDCVYVEPDIDYFKDTFAHLLLEVIPNALGGNVSSPRTVYVLRWVAGQHAGVPNFDPLYTIE